MGISSIAAGISIASAGFGGASKVMQGEATSSADTFQAELAQRNATYGELKAQQTAGQLTRNLNLTLGNMDAVRAASRADPSSPSGAAVRDYVETTGTTQKDIQVANIEEQAAQNEADAAYLRSASSFALLTGDISGIAAFGGAAGGGNSAGGNPLLAGLKSGFGTTYSPGS